MVRVKKSGVTFKSMGNFKKIWKTAVGGYAKQM